MSRPDGEPRCSAVFTGATYKIRQIRLKKKLILLFRNRRVESNNTHCQCVCAVLQLLVYWSGWLCCNVSANLLGRLSLSATCQ